MVLSLFTLITFLLMAPIDLCSFFFKGQYQNCALAGAGCLRYLLKIQVEAPNNQKAMRLKLREDFFVHSALHLFTVVY